MILLSLIFVNSKLKCTVGGADVFLQLVADPPEYLRVVHKLIPFALIDLLVVLISIIGSLICFLILGGSRGQNECHLSVSVLGNISTTFLALSVGGNISNLSLECIPYF